MSAAKCHVCDAPAVWLLVFYDAHPPSHRCTDHAWVPGVENIALVLCGG